MYFVSICNSFDSVFGIKTDALKPRAMYFMGKWARTLWPLSRRSERSDSEAVLLARLLALWMGRRVWLLYFYI